MDAIDNIVRDADAPASGRNAPRWRRIAEELEQDIRNGVVPTGNPLPTVLELASRFAVNRHTVRQALQFLQMRGLVSIEQGRGTFVRRPTFDYRLGRRVRFADSFIGDSSTDNTLIGAMEVEEALDKDAHRLNLPVGTLLWRFRTLRHAGGAPLATSMHCLEHARWPDFDRHFVRAGKSFTRALTSYGLSDYVRLSTRISAVLPTPQEQELLNISSTEPLLLSRAIDGVSADDPIHAVTTAFIGARIDFVVEPPVG